jgi:hypothetical protein
MSLEVYKGEDRSFPTEFGRLMYVNVKLTMEGLQWEKTELIWDFPQNSLINHSTHSYP